MQHRIWKMLIILAALFWVAGCTTPDAANSKKKATASQAAQGTNEQAKYPKLFFPAATCAGCHDNLKDSDGNSFSLVRDWSTSMHASAAHDPYFLATVRSEVKHHQELGEVIESTCATCHMPMARTTALAVEESVQMLDSGFLDANHPLHGLGADAVSCQLCHQVQAQEVDSEARFSGRYEIDLTAPPGERPLFGPFEVADTTRQLKKAVIGSAVKQTDHLGKSEFCGVCHTLYTPVVDEKGQLQEKPFPEQMVYLEWQNSRYLDQVSCQDCHMPQVQGSTVLANVSGLPARKPVFKHTFVGANSYMIGLVAKHPEKLKVSADTPTLQSAAQASQDFLRTQAADLSANATRNGSTVTVTVQVDSKTGHKLPSGYPSRRAWLHLTVQDASGKVLFESGQYGPDGKIVENDNDQDASRYEPHYDQIDDPTQVQIYEAILGNMDGDVTTELLRANRYLKDNRLLPQGFVQEGAVEDIRVRGEAAEDASFTAGRDTVTYLVDISNSAGTLTITVEMLYQPIGYRWANNISSEGTMESQALQGFIEAEPLLPVQVAESKVEIQ